MFGILLIENCEIYSDHVPRPDKGEGSQNTTPAKYTRKDPYNKNTKRISALTSGTKGDDCFGMTKDHFVADVQMFFDR